MDYVNVPVPMDDTPAEIGRESRFYKTQAQHQQAVWDGRQFVQDILFGSTLSPLKLEAIFDLFVHSADYAAQRWVLDESSWFAYDVDADYDQSATLNQLQATRENFIQAMRKATGDKAVLSVIGEIQGLDDVNNPAFESWVPVASFSPAKIKERLRPPAVLTSTLGGGISIPNALYWKNEGNESSGYDTLKSARVLLPLRVYGEHSSEKRILEFWKAFHCRINIGDSVPHAIHVARLHLNSFGVLSRPEMQFSFKFFYPNELTDKLYQPQAMLERFPDLKNLSVLIQKNLANQLFSLYEKLLPLDYAEDEKKGAFTLAQKNLESSWVSGQSAIPGAKAALTKRQLLLAGGLGAGILLLLASKGRG